MANKTIPDYPDAGGIDPVQDEFLLWQQATNTYRKINRNTIMGNTGNPVDTSSTQTLTNKTLTSPTISNPVLSGTITGTYTLGGTPTFPSTIVTTTGVQTLTNKTLTSPTISGGSIANSTVTVDAVSGYTTANSGSMYGIAVTNAKINGTTISNGTIASSQIATNGVSASNLATNAITLGYAQITSNFSAASTTGTQITGLTVNVTIPSGGRRIRITIFGQRLSNTVSNDTGVQIWDGTVGSGTQLANNNIYQTTAGGGMSAFAMAIVSPAAGSKTYNAGIYSAAGTATLSASATAPAFILVEAI